MMILPIYHNKYKKPVWFLLDATVGENLAGQARGGRRRWLQALVVSHTRTPRSAL